MYATTVAIVVTCRKNPTKPKTLVIPAGTRLDGIFVGNIFVADYKKRQVVLKRTEVR